MSFAFCPCRLYFKLSMAFSCVQVNLFENVRVTSKTSEAYPEMNTLNLELSKLGITKILGILHHGHIFKKNCEHQTLPDEKRPMLSKH